MNDNNIIDVSESDFESKVLEESSKKLIIVDFWAPWCGPCKQLTPILEKNISKSPEKIILAKINIDENQQIASQLRIQSIPAVYAFKDKQVVNAFQGVIPEREVIKFIEKSLGDKLENNYEDFYNETQNLINEKRFTQAKEILENFIFENSKEIKAICMYIEVLIGLNEIDSIYEFIESIEDELKNSDDIKNIIKRINLIKKTIEGPSIEKLFQELSNAPQNIDIVFKISETYFANNDFDASFEILLEHYPKNKEKIKSKILSFFEVLGFKHPSTILYRKKLSSIIFS
tara:strand:- start:3708 stop:4571 length:864 start_codon:yes stop_codon:yes gene_type:complete